MKISIKLKLSLFLAFLLILTVSILSMLVLSGITQNQRKDYENYLAQQTKTINTYIKQMDIGEKLEENVHRLAVNINSINNMYITIYDMKGKELFNSFPYKNNEEIDRLLSYALKDKISYRTDDDYVNYMAPIYDEEQIGVISFYYPLRKENEFYNTIKLLFIEIGLLVFILSFTCAYVYANIFTKNIIKLKENTRFIKTGEYDSVKKLKRKDELGELSEDIYYMSIKIRNNILDMEEEERKLNLALQKLRKLEKQQKNFIGNITHEFKTPLTVIKTYIDLLDMYEDDIKLLSDAKINIGREIQKLSEMVEKTLYLSSLQKYDFELNNQNINILEILSEICSRMEGKAQKFGINIVKNLQNGFIKGDKENLTHIFINIIDNAIKYNIPEGSIWVKNYERDNRVFIEISDSGIGISEREKEKIFEPFYTVDKARSKKYGGTGLGLSLVKELVQKQNGEIYILKNNKEITTFCISFPCLDENLQFGNN